MSAFSLKTRDTQSEDVDQLALLSQLNNLREAGVLTDEEYEAKKSEILKRI